MDNNPNKPLEDFVNNFNRAKRRIPVIAGNTVVNFALDNFERQGFLGNTLERWRPRKNPNKWGLKPPRNNRPILVDTGTLRRSIRVVSANMDAVVVGSDVPYAKAHNEGARIGIIQNVKAHNRKLTKVGVVKKLARKTKTNIVFGRVQTGETTVKAHTRKINQNIPKRQFLGDSPYLRQSLSRKIAFYITKNLKP